MQTNLPASQIVAPRRARNPQIALAALAASLMAVSGCSVPSRRAVVAAIVYAQADQWNRGDIDGFMKYYKKSDDISFSSGGQTRRGWQATSDHFKSRYDTREKMGRLTFSDIEVTPLGETHSLVLGRWKLDRQGPVGGNFTLIVDEMQREPKIIHDHTSLEKAE